MEARRNLIAFGALVAIALTAMALLWPRTEPASAGIPTLLGDVSCDGMVSIADAQLIAQLIVGRISELNCANNADVNGDDATSITDAQLIAQLIAGRINSLPPPTVRILRPAGDQAVPVVISVEFESPKFAHVLVRPIPEDPNQDYWVQTLAASTGPDLWDSSPVLVGQKSDPGGLPFKICVVITSRMLSPGQRLRELPIGPSHCVDVTRQ